MPKMVTLFSISREARTKISYCKLHNGNEEVFRKSENNLHCNNNYFLFSCDFSGQRSKYNSSRQRPKFCQIIYICYNTKNLECLYISNLKNKPLNK